MLSVHLTRATSSFNFNFSQPGGYNPADLNLFFLNSTDLSFQGDPDAHFDADTTEVEKNSGNRSIGRVLHAQPVALWDNDTGDGELASFNMSFCFRFKQGNTSRRNSSDARVAFFLGPYPSSVPPPLSNGENHGHFSNHSNSNVTSEDQILEVEFDTCLQKKLDNGSNHMSINVNTIVSKVQINTAVPDKNLSSGGTILIVQINYDNKTQMLTTALQIGDAAYHINTSVDLRRWLPNEVVVGFSATTGQPIELQNVLCWSFNSTLEWKNSSVMPPVPTPQPLATNSPSISWKQLWVRLDPWNWYVELNLQFQFQRSWDRLKLAVNHDFNVSLAYEIANWN